MSSLSDDEFADRVRDIIQNENTLENNRLQWMLVIQGFLFTALGIVVGKPERRSVLVIVAVMGLLSSLLTWIHLLHSRKAMEDNAAAFKKKFPAYDGPPVIGLDPRRIGTPIKYVTPPYLMPVIFAAGWVAVLWVSG